MDISSTTCTTLISLTKHLRQEGLLAGETNLHGAEATHLSGADCDSRVVAPGHIFICKGAAFCPDYLRSALDSGALAYLCDTSHAATLAKIAPSVPALVAPDDGLRRAMALVSADTWGHPDQSLRIVGITGTKGKSTVAYMIRAIMDAGHDGEGKEGDVASIIGSIDTYDGVIKEESHNTTPEAPDLWRHLANARATGHDPMVMEVSSQALKYDRVNHLHLSAACFLNIGRDHISPIEHPDFNDYFTSKLRIFALGDTAVVNLDTDHLPEVLSAAQKCCQLISFAVADTNGSAPTACGYRANIWADHVIPDGNTVSFMAHTPKWTAKICLGVPGLFNVDNALCAIAVANLLNIEYNQIRIGLLRCRVPGRMELLDSPDPHVAAIVDYAHNKLSFQRFFSSVAAEFPGRRIIAVFGAPGGKAQERRHELPTEAARWADVLIYTEEDPAHERAEDICAQMLAATPAGQRAESIPDRPRAIARSVEIAYEEPTPALICLLAKGDETRQHEGDLFVPCEPDGTLFLRAMAAFSG